MKSSLLILVVGIIVLIVAAGFTALTVIFPHSPSSTLPTVSSSSSSSYSSTTGVTSSQSLFSISSATSTSTTTSRIITTTISSSSSQTGNNPNIVYIWTNNSADDWTTSIYSALDTNTGQYAWVFETGYHDSVLAISNNQVTSHIASFFPEMPTGITFDSRNNIAYVTYGIPTDCNVCPYGFSAISQDHLVKTPVKPQHWPAGLAYDEYYDFLYFSYGGGGTSGGTGIAVFDPNNGIKLADISTGDSPTLFSYDSSNGDMFAAASNSSETTIHDLSGLSLVSSFTVTGSTASMIYDQGNGYLYLAEAGGNILVVNPSNQNVVGMISGSNPPWSLVYDGGNQYVYCLGAGEMLVISGTSVVSSASIPHNVTSALYNPPYDNILAFY